MQIAKLGMILKTSGKLLYDGQMGTIILKIDLEIAEIIEVKVGNHHLEIDILLLHRGLFGSKFPEFYKNVPTFEICMSRSRQKSK